MVKRKRTLSIKENSESISQVSDGDLGSDEAKRLKTMAALEKVRVWGGLVRLLPPITPMQPPPNLSAPRHRVTPSTTSQPQPNVPSSAPPPQPAALRPTPQLRTSARVLNKQRREETKADLPPPALSVGAKKQESGGVDGEFGDEEDGKKRREEEDVGKKRRRAWELWSLEDKNIFFESINECGKDFEAIQVGLARSEGMYWLYCEAIQVGLARSEGCTGFIVRLSR
ncbi:Protein cramped-like [Chionoecetes opilio]|uniref:Protein cramped-like n=1 Tax=Chionoecetes opilio TaxID=41210 RepID=A0A8J4YEN0_CHIOP|nr:Protein cramped-like [Chionoecetes opilio]